MLRADLDLWCYELCCVQISTGGAMSCVATYLFLQPFDAGFSPCCHPRCSKDFHVVFKRN